MPRFCASGPRGERGGSEGAKIAAASASAAAISACAPNRPRRPQAASSGRPTAPAIRKATLKNVPHRPMTIVRRFGATTRVSKLGAATMIARCEAPSSARAARNSGTGGSGGLERRQRRRGGEAEDEAQAEAGALDDQSGGRAEDRADHADRRQQPAGQRRRSVVMGGERVEGDRSLGELQSGGDAANPQQRDQRPIRPLRIGGGGRRRERPDSLART